MKTTPLKRMARIIPGQSPPGATVESLADGLPFIQGNAEFSSVSPIPTSQCPNPPKVALQGDLLFSVRAPVGAINVADRVIGIGRGIAAIRSLPVTDSRFLLYALGSRVGELRSVATGSTYEAVNAVQLGALLLPSPTMEEQRRIADFLDDQVSRVDNIIAARRRQAARLRAALQSAVTERIASEPGDECPIKFKTTLITDGAHVSPELEGGVYDFVSTRDLVDDRIAFEGSLKTSPASYEYLVRMGCRPRSGDVLFSKDGTVGRTVVVDREHEFVVASSLIIMRPDPVKLDGYYLHYLCQSAFVSDQIQSYVRGAGLPRLSIANLNRIIGRFPELDRQRIIAAELRLIEADTFSANAALESSIALLTEYKESLISAAVTGKVDVATASSRVPE